MKQKTLFTVISVLLFFSMSLSLSAINSFSLLKGFKSGTGTADDPYVITDLSHLENLSKTVNSGNNCSGLFFSLEADIIMNSVKEKIHGSLSEHFHQIKIVRSAVISWEIIIL